MDRNRKLDEKPRAKNDAIWHDGFSYNTRYFKKAANGEEVRYLTCKDRFCRASASVKANGNFTLGRIIHAHPRDKVSERNNRFMRNLKTAVFEGHNRALRDIYNEISLLYPQAVLYSPYTKVVGSMRRWRGEARVDALAAAPAVGGRPVVDGADNARADDLADANDTDTAPVDDFNVADNTDAATVDGAAVTGGAGVAHHADPDGSVLTISNINRLVAADPAEVPNNDVVSYMDIQHCMVCELNKITHIYMPCGHFVICDDCAEIQILSCSENQQCVKCGQAAESIVRVLYQYDFIQEKL